MTNLRVPLSSSRLRNHVLQVWSETDDRIDHDREIIKFPNPSPRVRDFGVSGTPIHNPSNPTRFWNYLEQHIRNWARSNGSVILNPGIAQYGKSVRGSNGIQIEIREILRARDNLRIATRHSATALPSPTRRQRWVSKAITHRRKISKPRLQTPTLGITPYLEPLLFLDLPQKLTGSGWTRRPKLGRISIWKLGYLRSKLMQTYPTIS